MVYNWQQQDWRNFQYEGQALTHVSKATATRHLQDLVEKKILIVRDEGRNTNYQANL